MKKQMALFIGIGLFVILSVFAALTDYQVQAQGSGGREASYVQLGATDVIIDATPFQVVTAMGLPPSAVASITYNGSDVLGFGVGNTPLGVYFPTEGNTFAILSTGLAGNADKPNLEPNLSDVLTGLDNSQGQDMTQLSLKVNVPANVTCLGFDYAFYSEEFPEFVNTSFNDTFTAELGGTALSIVTTTVTSPLNFAFGAIGEIMSVNTVFGVMSNTLSTYDGVTPLLRATTPVTPNVTVELVLTVQDLGDSIYDSAVFLDNFFFSSDDCQSGTGFTPTTGNISPNGGTLSYTNINGDQTTLDFPPGAVSELTQISFTPLYTPSHPLGLGLLPRQNQAGLVHFAGHAFDIEGLILDQKQYLPFATSGGAAASIQGGAQPFWAAPTRGISGTFPLNEPVTIVIEYSDSDLEMAGIVDEMTLALWLYNEELQEWEDARFTCDPIFFQIDPVANTLTVNVCHFTEFGLVG